MWLGIRIILFSLFVVHLAMPCCNAKEKVFEQSLIDASSEEKFFVLPVQMTLSKAAIYLGLSDDMPIFELKCDIGELYLPNYLCYTKEKCPRGHDVKCRRCHGCVDRECNCACWCR